MNGQRIRELIEGCSCKEARSFSGAFAHEASASGDKEEWRLLEAVFCFSERWDDAKAPFGPISTWEDRRTIIPTDLKPDKLTHLAATLDAVEDPEYRARIRLC